MKTSIKEPWVIERTWVLNPPDNTVRVQWKAIDNGQVERIHYTNLVESVPGFDEFQPVKNSVEGHGYGAKGEALAKFRVKRMLDGDEWRKFTTRVAEEKQRRSRNRGLIVETRDNGVGDDEGQEYG